MKNKIAFLTPILCALLLLMQGCSFFSPFPNNEKSLHNTVLKTITDTMTPRPDVALEMIVSLSDTLNESRMSKIEYYEYQILIAEALYKNDYQQTNDSAIIAAVNFFDSLALKHPKNTDVIFQKARAHYYKGVGEYEKEFAIVSSKDFMSALNTIDQIDCEKEKRNDVRHFKALTYSRLAQITYWYEINKISIDLHLSAIELLLKEEDYHTVAVLKNYLAVMYNKTDCSDIALTNLYEADSILNLCEDDDFVLRKKISTNKASALFNLGNQKDAERIVRDLLNQPFNFEDSYICYGIMAAVYYNENQYDSAIYYYERYFGMHKFSRMDAARRIIEICNITGDKEKAAQYAPYLADDTAEEIALTSVKNEIVAAYEQYLADKEAHENKKMWSIILVLVVVFASLTVGALSLNNILKKRRHRKDIERKDIEIQSLNKEISDKDWLVGVMKGRARSTSKETDELKEKLKKLQDENNELKSVSKQETVDNQQDTIKKPSLDECIKELTTDETCRRVAAMNEIFVKTNGSYPDMLLDSETQRTVVQTVERILGDSLRDVMPKGSKLKFDDKLLLSLCLLGLDDKHIAVATGLAYSTVYRRMQRMLGDLGK